MRIAKIVESSHVDGPGERAVLFVQGCPVRCTGCQSPQLWDEHGGTEMPVAKIAAKLMATGLPITISGGEPFAQAIDVAMLIAIVRIQKPNAHFIVYSGYTLDRILAMSYSQSAMRVILDLADVLVDGPFMPELDDDYVQWRGSRNQRPINLRKSRISRLVHELVVEDWDTQVVSITDEGDVVGTKGTMRDLFRNGRLPSSVLLENRMCGQTEED